LELASAHPKILKPGTEASLFAYVYDMPLTFMDQAGLQGSPGQRDPFVPLMPGPDFDSGLWGTRPDQACCDEKEIARAIASDELQIGRLDRGEPLVGVPLGATYAVPIPIAGRPGWYIERPMPSDPPFDPNTPSGLDPCVEYCTRVHEWFHYVDRRPRFEGWAGSQYLRFVERPAYVLGLECLYSFR